jgi:hypothetical protein
MWQVSRNVDLTLFIKQMQELNHKRIRSFAKQLLPQNEAPEFLESMERFLQNPEVVACLESQNDPGFSGPSASDITHYWKLVEAHWTSSMAQKIDVAESGQGASCVVIFFPYLDFYRVPGFQLILFYPVLTYRRHLLRCSFQHV